MTLTSDASELIVTGAALLVLCGCARVPSQQPEQLRRQSSTVKKDAVLDFFEGGDPNLRIAIDLMIQQLPEGSSSSEWASNVRSLNLGGLDIVDIHGIGLFSNLEALNLEGNQIQGLDELSKLDRLTSLDLGASEVADQDLEALPGSLIYLSLAGNDISSVSFLCRLQNLRCVSLRWTNVTSLDGFGCLGSALKSNDENDRLNMFVGDTPLAGKLQSENEKMGYGGLATHDSLTLLQESNVYLVLDRNATIHCKGSVPWEFSPSPSFELWPVGGN